MHCPTYELSCINWVELLPALFAHRWPGVGHMLGCVCTAANLRWRMLLAVQAFDPFGQRIPMLGCMTARQWASVLAGGFQAFPGWHVVKGGLPLLFVLVLLFQQAKRGWKCVIHVESASGAAGSTDSCCRRLRGERVVRFLVLCHAWAQGGFLPPWTNSLCLFPSRFVWTGACFWFQLKACSLGSICQHLTRTWILFCPTCSPCYWVWWFLFWRLTSRYIVFIISHGLPPIPLRIVQQNLSNIPNTPSTNTSWFGIPESFVGEGGIPWDTVPEVCWGSRRISLSNISSPKIWGT